MEVKEVQKKLRTDESERVMNDSMKDDEGKPLNQSQFAAVLEVDDDTVSKGIKFVKALCLKRPVRLMEEEVTEAASYHLKKTLDTIENQGDYLRIKR